MLWVAVIVVVVAAVAGVILWRSAGNHPSQNATAASAIGPTGSLRILSGTDSFSSVSGSNKILVVSSGAMVSGTIRLQALNSGKPDAVAPLIYTPSWGDSSSSWRLINRWVPTGQSQQTAQVSFVSPATPGLYYIIFAFQWEIGGDHVASATNWPLGADRWGDGNDLATLSVAQITEAQAHGETTANWLVGNPASYKLEHLPADVITLVVQPVASAPASALTPPPPTKPALQPAAVTESTQMVPTNQSLSSSAGQPQSSDPRALLGAAKSQYALHQYQNVIAYCSQALALNSSYADAWYLKANAEDAIHNPTEAITDYGNFMRFAPSQDPRYSTLRAYAKTRLTALTPK
jgi:hypothetical protein